jgi:hypothetical protein
VHQGRFHTGWRPYASSTIRLTMLTPSVSHRRRGFAGDKQLLRQPCYEGGCFSASDALMRAVQMSAGAAARSSKTAPARD